MNRDTIAQLLARNNGRIRFFTASAGLALKPRTATFSADKTAPDGTTLVGYAIVWDAISDDRGGFAVKCVRDSVTFAQPTLALFHHDFRAVLGNTDNNTLRLTSDDHGIKCEIDLPDTSVARDVAELVGKQYVRGMSFSMLFDGLEYDVENADTPDEVQVVKSFNCDEVTITAIPAFTETEIAVAGDDQPAEPALAAASRVDDGIRLAKLRLGMMSL